MKKLFLLFVSFFFSVAVFSQGTILGFTVEPQSPTESDFVKVYVGLAFTSGGCDLDHKNHITTGTITNANTHHCMGMLTYICQTTDTFDLGYLQTGTHKFRLGLTSGSFPAPCTPGIIEDDRDSITFFVSTANGLFDLGIKQQTIKLYPNPANSTIYIELIENKSSVLFNPKDYQIKVINALGKEALACPSQEEVGGGFWIDISSLQKGIYFLGIYKDSQLIVARKFVKE